MKEFDIEKIAELARLKLTQGEKETLSSDLANILKYVEKLDSLDIKSISPTSHVLNIENVYREDSAVLTSTADAVLKVLPDERKHEHFFKVPKVIEDK
jgi:aspartyl-tRNA(Asn)/glutamyl-tRNA(Gln) amidotransferase subunit C